MGQFRADVINGADAGGGNKGLVEREVRLPTGADLPLLYQLLIPQGLASAFRISPQQNPTVADVDRASVTTFYSIQSGSVSNAPPHPERKAETARKKQRIVWTPELQRRFLDVVRRLGVNNAVPKAIMQMMNVEGLSRMNVASHLQKYRLYLKRRQGFTGGDATSSSSRRGING
ncbi:PREDICTED: transcription factor BOA-like [Tarenaya hassleriana]|uniref:transcription factor BOA-like n=1 Tax=Tarenaya hassleriana TaxID=28532 RepID=UPI00053C3B1C|nr:PREDICTED: transcription factor BOA-like [Tarenaya hassleriana]